MARILVVDDEEQICGMLKALLELDGHEVLTASDGIEAGLMMSGAVDLVIVDIIMPHKTGIDFVQELRELRPDMPVLLMSGGGSFKSGTDDGLYRHWIEVERLVRKPFSHFEIREAIDEMIGAA